MSLKMVFEPITIGKVEIKNRVLRTAHGTSLAKPDINDEFIAYHLERARGGCGLSILEAASPHHSSKLDMRLFGDAIVPGYQRMMAAIRPHGMKVFQQLWHGGAIYPGFSGIPWAVSTVPSHTGIVGQPMTDGQIGELIESFAQAALNCQEGGIDGVEVHAAHGYIFHQFLTPAYNTRTDRWGGDFEGRSRFLMEVMRAIRAAVDPGFAVGVRLSESEAPGGITIEDNHRLLDMLQAENLIDFADCSLGDYYSIDAIVGPMPRDTGYELKSSGRVLEKARVPRIVAGRFRTLEEVDQVLRDGVCDMVSMVRAQIADPFLVAKTQAGHPEQVRPCLGCNQGCSGSQIREGRIGCTVNPSVSYEDSLSETLIAPSANPRKVMVIGGGPAGMEAARVARLQGHDVTLLEASPQLGGQVRVAGMVPRLAGLADVIVWQEQELYRLGVDVRLGTYAEADDVRAAGADVVIVATGAWPRMDGFVHGNPGAPARGVDQPHVVSSIDLITDPRRALGRTALVMDSAGGYEAIAVCEYLIEKGVAVTLVCMHGNMTPYAQTYGRDGPAVERMMRSGNFSLMLRQQIYEIGPDSCTVGLVHMPGNAMTQVPADTVVLVSPNEPMRGLYDELRDAAGAGDGPELYLVGDAFSPRDVQYGIAEAHRVARALG